jgi:hypothetical protein
MIKSSGAQICVLSYEQKAKDEPSFISTIIMGDESMIYGYDPETKQQRSQWKSP